MSKHNSVCWLIWRVSHPSAAAAVWGDPAVWWEVWAFCRESGRASDNPESSRSPSRRSHRCRASLRCGPAGALSGGVLWSNFSHRLNTGMSALLCGFSDGLWARPAWRMPFHTGRSESFSLWSVSAHVFWVNPVWPMVCHTLSRWMPVHLCACVCVVWNRIHF